MVRQSVNTVNVEGILSEINLKENTYKGKDGQDIESVGGTIKIRVDQEINGIMKRMEVPISLFSNKYTLKRTINPSYESISKVMKEFISIAAAGDENKADRVRINGGNVRMNEYFRETGEAVLPKPRLHASFISRVKSEEFKPSATFDMELVMMADPVIQTVQNQDGTVSEKLQLKAGVVGYNERFDIVPLVVLGNSAKDAIQQYWTEGDTVRAKGRVNFTYEQKKIIEEVDFGEPQERIETSSISELVVTGGTQVPLSGEAAYGIDDIKRLCVERAQRLEVQKQKDMNRSRTQAPSNIPSQAPSKGSFNLGF